MSCVACAKAVERSVAKVGGVASVSVNFATEKARVIYDGSRVRPSEIKQAIARAGYTPLVADAGAKVDEHRKAKERELRVLWSKLAVSATLAVPLLYVAMGGMLGWPLPPAIDPMGHPLRYAPLELALLAPIIAAGHRFYVVGFKALLHASPNMDSLIAMGPRRRSSTAASRCTGSRTARRARPAAAMSLSSVSALLNALRLKRFQPFK